MASFRDVYLFILLTARQRSKRIRWQCMWCAYKKETARRRDTTFYKILFSLWNVIKVICIRYRASCTVVCILFSPEHCRTPIRDQCHWRVIESEKGLKIIDIQCVCVTTKYFIDSNFRKSSLKRTRHTYLGRFELRKKYVTVGKSIWKKKLLIEYDNKWPIWRTLNRFVIARIRRSSKEIVKKRETRSPDSRIVDTPSEMPKGRFLRSQKTAIPNWKNYVDYESKVFGLRNRSVAYDVSLAGLYVFNNV